MRKFAWLCLTLFMVAFVATNTVGCSSLTDPVVQQDDEEEEDGTPRTPPTHGGGVG